MAEHTPGDWGWFGNEYGFYLATKHSGRRFVMDFVRMGMRGAQPRFQIDGRMVKGADLVRFEVDRSVQGFTAGKASESVYRYDIVEINHPDARLIAAAPQLKAALEAIVEDLLDGDWVSATQIARHAGKDALAASEGESG